jgi:formylmethanofuran dehydrogenase subunit E
MSYLEKFPKDFQECVDFHGHLCPGLAIGYGAVKAAREILPLGESEDEEVVAVVENDSCAVDAVQVLLGCTFGKGNLIFRDWGKQVFTFFDRDSDRAVRVALKTMPAAEAEKRRELREKINSGTATEPERNMWEELKTNAALAIVDGAPNEFYDVKEVSTQPPPKARIIDTVPCDACGEDTMTSKTVTKNGRTLCQECAQAG